MSEFHQIQEERFAAIAEFDRRVVELQARCPHEELTGWLQDYDFDVRACKNCWKTMEKRARQEKFWSS